MQSALFRSSLLYKPFHYPWAVDIAKKHEQVHWLEAEADLTDDVTDWKAGRISDREKHFITQILRLFTTSDVAVGTFYYRLLIPRIFNNEVVNMFGLFAGRESLHQRAYALLNDTLGLPDSEFHAFMDYAEMREKSEHMLAADTSTDTGLLLALARGVFNEGVSLFASFAMLLSFQREGKMKGMGKIVEWSQRDETIHVEGLAAVFSALATEQPELVTSDLKLAIYDLARETVRLEDAFIDLAFEMGGISKLTPEEVKSYIRYVADRRLVQLGLKENWGIVDNPLPWIDWIMAGADHTNFFEGKVTGYDAAGLVGDWGYSTPDRVGEEFVVYTKPNCPFCLQVKDAMASFGIRHEVVDLTNDTERAIFYDHNGFTAASGPYGRSMPKVYERLPSGRLALVGGATEFMRRFIRQD